MTINKGINETEAEFCERIFKLKFVEDLTWREVAYILNKELDKNLSEDAYRKRANKLNISNDGEEIVNQLSWENINKNAIELSFNDEFDELDEILKEKQKLKDERTQINSILRRITREETLKEMVHDAVSLMDKKFKLLPPEQDNLFSFDKTSKNAVLQLSDLHYGIEINNYWNKYNPEICKKRLEELQNQVIKKCIKENVSTLFIVNLGDLISGRIHAPLRINSRIDVVTQTQQVTELIAQFLANLSEHFTIEYYDCLDNHSRIEPIKENSLDLESLARFTSWYLKERLKDFHNIHINDENKFAPDIINFEVLGHKIIAVHGDKDTPSKVIQNLSLMTQEHYDLVLTSHRHHFSADEVNQTLLLSNGSMMGTDAYAEKLRLNAKPSQNLIIASEDNVMDVFYRIVLN